MDKFSDVNKNTKDEQIKNNHNALKDRMNKLLNIMKKILRNIGKAINYCAKRIYAITSLILILIERCYVKVKQVVKNISEKSKILQWFEGKLHLLINKIGRVASRIHGRYSESSKDNKYMESFVFLGLPLFIAILLIFSLKVAMKTEEHNIANNKADELYLSNNYDAAIEEYNTLQQDEEWPEYIVKQAEIYSVAGNYKKSNTLLSEAVISRYKIIEAEGRTDYLEEDKKFMNDVVFTFFMNKEYEEAYSLGESYLSEDKDNKDLMRTMFTVYMSDGKAAKAKEIVENYPVDKESAYDLALNAKMYMLIDQWDKGFELLKESWYKDKNEVKSFDVITQFASYDRDEILNKLTELSNKDKNETVYKLWKAKVYSLMPETINLTGSIIDSLEDKYIGNVPVKVMKAQILKNNGDAVKANEIINDIINKESSAYIGHHIAAWQALESSDYEGAFELCKKSIIENKQYPDNYGFLIPEIMMAKGDSENVEAYFRTALSKEPFNRNIVIKIAEYYSNKALNNEKAIEYYNLALNLKPDDAEVYYNIAALQEIEGETDLAIKDLKNAIALNVDNGKYYRTLGTVYLNEKQGEQAIEAIRKAYAIDENDILTLNNAGCFYISIESDIERGLENLKAAYEGINDKTDGETKKIITDNYTKAKKLYEDYMRGDGTVLRIPEFELFY